MILPMHSVRLLIYSVSQEKEKEKKNYKNRKMVRSHNLDANATLDVKQLLLLLFCMVVNMRKTPLSIYDFIFSLDSFL